jgi:hypothetical protein
VIIQCVNSPLITTSKIKIYKIVNLLLVLYGFKSWSPFLGEEQIKEV